MGTSDDDISSRRRHGADHMQIPGASELSEQSVPRGVYLLTGPAGSGKTMYCRQFLLNGLQDGICVIVSPSLGEKEFKDLFSSAHPESLENLKFINPSSYPSHSTGSGHRRVESSQQLKASLNALRDFIDASKKEQAARAYGVTDMCVAVDSLTYLVLLFGERAVIKYVLDLCLLLKQNGAGAILIISESDQHLRNKISFLADGIIELKLDEGQEGSLIRSIRLLSVKGMHHKPFWVTFAIAENGDIIIGGQQITVSHSCTLCRKPIIGTPIMYSDFAFDTMACLETYRKFEGVYGSNISETGLPAEATNVSFFFTDIVGLSNPTLSVRKQIQKIQTLNELIATCVAFKMSPKDKRIVLPTGDGMAIGYLLNPALPLELSIEIHRGLRKFNRNKRPDDQIGVRIGLASGLIFTVMDVNNLQNVWGPGIILARRVMDAGDNGHILLADNLAEQLISIKDEYRNIIRPIASDFQIKHGQRIRLYSAYSNEFGNAELPSRVSPTSREIG